MLGENYEAPDPKTLRRSKSDTDVAATAQTGKNVATGVTVDSNLNLDPLEEFMSIVSNDDVTMDFFSRLPGFTYQYARYTDWIGQYLHTLTEIDANDSKKMSKNQKAGLKALNKMYARYEKFLQRDPASSQRDDQQDGQGVDVQMIDTAAEPRSSTPMPYMILRAESENDAGLRLEDCNGLLLTTVAVKCSYVDSRPDSSTNLAVS